MSGHLNIGNKPSFFQKFANLEENPKLKLTLKVMGVAMGVIASIAIPAGIAGGLSLGGVHIFAVIHSPYNIAMVSAGGTGLITASVIINVRFTIKYLNREKEAPIREEEVEIYGAKTIQFPVGKDNEIELTLQVIPVRDIETYLACHSVTITKLLQEQKMMFACINRNFMDFECIQGILCLDTNAISRSRFMEGMKHIRKLYPFSCVITDFNAFKQIVEKMESEEKDFDTVMQENEDLGNSIIQIPEVEVDDYTK